MIEFKRNKKTGIVESWENGKKIGEVITMGDIIEDRPTELRKGKRDERDKAYKQRQGSNKRTT